MRAGLPVVAVLFLLWFSVCFSVAFCLFFCYTWVVGFVGVLPVSSFSFPASVSSLLASASVVGFSGSRSPGSASLFALRCACAAVPASVSSVAVGCASGVDGSVRSLLGGSLPVSVFLASLFGGVVPRSVACVRWVAGLPVSSPGGSPLAVPSGGSRLWVSFPSSPCPPGLVPSASASRCFCGSGSGSWASLALAVGLGVPSLLWLPGGFAPPSSWGFRSLGGGWFSWSPGFVALSLF